MELPTEKLKLTLGNKIRMMRELRGLKQDYIAAQLEMTQNGYGKIERDETDVSYSRLENICKILGISITDLINLDQNKLEMSITNSQNHVQNQAYLIQNHEGKELYEKRITDLQNEITFLREMVEKAMYK
jgi:transcriptional regulator with XRE-family HTH domain